MTVVERQDREHYDSMCNRLEIMSEALKVFAYGRGKLAGMARTIIAANTEIGAAADQAWRNAHDPRWEGPAFTRFVAQRHAELAQAYALVQTIYDELCDYGIIPKDMRTEETTADMVAALVAAEKEAKKRQRRRKVAA